MLVLDASQPTKQSNLLIRLDIMHGVNFVLYKAQISFIAMISLYHLCRIPIYIIVVFNMLAIVKIKKCSNDMSSTRSVMSNCMLYDTCALQKTSVLIKSILMG